MAMIVLLAGLLCAGPAPARDGAPPPPDAGAAQARDPSPLSKEDAELVQEMAVLERLELLKNLDLFEDPKAAKQPEQQKSEQRQP
jgi:hypothetical protein